ncbi:hypothetical protein [Methylocapsa aurea]|uniref:hypothetical protein n=1 Tax=Methylocapsa aurea TaxID=663610 RepID=UPI000560BAD9|nr:hypothetical protein [Methylocapsa aurea]
MDELIARIAAASGSEPEVARKAVGVILDFLRKEGPQAEVDELFASVPGAAEAAATAADSSGALSGLAGMMGGGLMGLAARLTALGLGMGQMQATGKEVFAFVREKAGDERVGQVAAAIPGLSQFL